MTGFKCVRCGDCCRWGGYVYITSEDITRIAKFLSMDEYDFVNKYAEVIDRARLSLKSKDNGECIFLNGNDCSIHAARPRQCETFPAEWRVKDLEMLCNGRKGIDGRDTGRP